MDWGRVRFFLSEVGRNFTRNVTMQLTAIATVAVTILILGGFVFVRAVLGSVGNDIVQRIEVSVFLKDGTDMPALRARILSDARVSAVEMVPKAQGLRDLSARLHGQIDTSLLTTNPLPDALHVKVLRPDDVPDVAAGIRSLDGVASVEYAQDAVAKMLHAAEVLSKIGIGIVILLVFTAAIIISNTIRLTVYARRREIAIMQLVGASNTYITLPFVCEGMLDGVLGACAAVGVLALARMQLLPKLATALPFVPLDPGTFDATAFSLELIGVGAALGIIASWISVGRYLRA